MNKGFTLIELLVVVLIIGILSAIALPQYQKAVDKTRATQAVQIINSLEKATEVLLLENPTATTNSCDPNAAGLAIDVPCNYDEDDNCWIGNSTICIDLLGGSRASVVAYHDYTTSEYVTIYAERSADGTWIHKCGYPDDRGKAICNGLQGYQAIEGFDY